MTHAEQAAEVLQLGLEQGEGLSDEDACEVADRAASLASAYALVSIAESLEKLVGATSDQSDSAYLNVVTHVGG
jgi:hypothetical protein